MTADVLVISTRAPAPRRVGGGLDSNAPPEAVPTRRPRDRRDLTIIQRPPDGSVPTGSSADDGPLCTDRPPRRRPLAPVAEPPASLGADALARLSVLSDELAVVVQHLAPVVPAPHADSTAGELARIASLKLASHRDCHEAWHPSSGSLDVVRARCRSLLASLSPADGAAIASLLLAELAEGVSR